MTGDREKRLRQALEADGMGLRRRADGSYHVTDAEKGGSTDTAPNGWRVRSWALNDRGGELGSPYPLTLDDVEVFISSDRAEWEPSPGFPASCEGTGVRSNTEGLTRDEQIRRSLSDKTV